MNAYLPLNAIELWHVAGWTMVHFLWLGALLGAAAAVSRLFLRRTSANVRYALMLVWLIALATLPIGIATWLCKNSPPIQTAAGEASITSPAEHSNLIELNNPKNNAPTPGEPASAGGIATAATEVDRDASTESPNKLPTNSIATPVPTSQLIATTFASCIPYLPWLWIIGTPITFVLLLTGLVGTRRLDRASRPITEGPIANMLAQLTTSLRIGKRVTIAVCDRIAAPVLIGIVRPIILLPPAALTGWSPDEIEMVLLHELAHVRRWDNLVNLLQRIVESLLFFHPAVWLI
jgi:beta-lactamase regulating signal transducer with metallopeptidase domain